MSAFADNNEDVETYAYIEEPKAENILDELASWAADQLFTDGREESRPNIQGLIRQIKAEAWEEGHSWGWSDAQEAHDVRQHMDRAEWPLRTPSPYTEES